MDIVGVLGYDGQEITFIDDDHFSFVSGKAIYVHAGSKGPRDVIWRQIYGVEIVRCHLETRRLVIVSSVPGHDLEIIDFPGQTFIASLKNPTDSKVIDVDFSRSGDKLFAISDILNHKIFSWEMTTQKLLFVTDLAEEYSRLHVNPTDSNKILLFGNSAIAISIVIEITGVSTVKFDSSILKCLNANGETNGETNDASLDSYQVSFAVWAPGDRIFFGTRNGRLFESGPNISRLFANVREVSGSNYPTAATLSSSNLVISTSNGDIFWYPLPETVSKTFEALVDPVQHISVGSHISSMLTDPSYQHVVIGTLSGTIHKFALDVLEQKRDDPDEELPGGLDKPLPLLDDDHGKLKIESCGTFQAGAVLCCRSFVLPVLSTSENVTKASATFSAFFVTGSHTGNLLFWKQPLVDTEPISRDAQGALYPGIRRSTPRPLKSAANCTIGDYQSGRSVAATSVEFLSFNQKSGHCLMVVGTSDGWLESWRLCAFDTEEEDDDEERAQGVDDEEEGIVKLCVARVSRQKLFSSAVSTISVSREDNKFYNVAVASVPDNHVYVLKVPADFSFNLSVSFVIEIPYSPTALCWAAKTLWITCIGGALYSFCAPKHLKGDGDVTSPSVCWDSQLKSIASACVTKGDCLVLISPDALVLRAYAIPSEAVVQQLWSSYQEAEGILTFPGPGSDFGTLSDSIVCSTVSSSGLYLATGTADGAVQVWFVNGSNIRVLSRALLHGSAVLALTFSADSSLLLSCSADGSVFISTIDEPTRAHLKTSIGDSKFFERVNNPEEPFPTVSDDGVFSPGSSTWLESKRVDTLRGLRESSSESLANIKASIDDISLRLRILLDRNDSRTELEKMSRAEFLVDLDRRTNIILQTKASTNDLRDLYVVRNLWNELVAARIRQKCWDAMDKQSSCIFPFLSEAFADFKFVSTFSIHTLTEDYTRRLNTMKRLRAIEIRSQRSHDFGVSQKLASGSSRITWITSVLGCPQTVSWIANDGDNWPTREISSLLHRGEKIEVAEVGKEKTSDRKDNGEGTGAGIPIANAAAPSAEDDDDASLTSLDADREVDENDILNLLYPPQSVRTEVQKRTQIFLLTEVARIVRMKFNDFVERLMQEKEDVIASIESRNIRINNILEELRLQDTFFVPKRSHFEVQGSVVVVHDGELSNRPYESETMRLARLEIEEERRRRDAEKDKEDIKGRALDEMMHGTLEIKRDVLGETSSMQRPQWMDEFSPGEMSDLQLKEFEAFEAKMKSIQEEQVKYRKGLEQELKKLKSESMDACRAFDEKLVSAAKLKIVTQRELLVQELYISKISVSLAKKEQAWNILKKSESQIADVRRQRGDIHVKLEGFRAFAEEVKSKLANLQEEEKALDRSFKRDLSNLCNTNFAQDDLKVFTQLYRLRTYPASLDDDGSFEFDGDESEFPMPHGPSQSRSRHGGASRGKGRASGASKKGSSASDHQHSKKTASKMMKMSKSRNSVGATKDKLGPMQEAARAMKNADNPQTNERDPFFGALLQTDKNKRSAEAQIPLLVPITIEADCPEGFKEKFGNEIRPIWAKLQDLRTIRIEKEIEVKQLSIDYTELKQKVDEISCEEGVLDTCIETMKKSRDAARNLAKSLETDLEVIICLRQGQDEVNHDELVTQYSESMLVPIEVVNKFNSRIKELGKEKIGVLSRIKQFRRKINLVDWEAKHLSLEACHLEEYFTDLQLLRVTRELQSVIRDGADVYKAKERLEKVNVRKDFMLKDADARASKLRKANDALRRQVQDRFEESSNLEGKIRELRVQLAARKSVKLSRDEARGVGGDPVSIASFRMKKVIARRQLVDTARVQAEEIEFLRRELDRLRQKTFPSFVRAAKSRVHSYPDDRL